jgi:hypothetical protein
LARKFTNFSFPWHFSHNRSWQYAWGQFNVFMNRPFRNRMPIRGGYGKKVQEYLPYFLLFGIAVGFRLYHIASDPLWLDEIMNVQMGQRGLAGLIRNSFTDPHPPLYYLISWFSTGCGSFSSEWAARWLSVLSGALTVPLVYHLARPFTGEAPAFLSSLLLAVSPYHIYYSQEARSYAWVTFLAALSVLVLLRIEKEPHKISRWAALAAITAIGFYCSYSYFLVAGFQALYLAWRYFHTRGLRIYLGLVVGPGLLLLPLAAAGLTSTAAAHLNTPPLNLVLLSQALFAGEAIRYGITWPHTVSPLLFAILIGCGAYGSFKILKEDSVRYPVWGYALLQVFAPLAFYFGFLNPLFDVHIPPNNSKQFLVLFPVIFLGVALGLKVLNTVIPHPAGRLLSLGLVLLLAIASLSNLQRYWTISKSPEGLAVGHVLAGLYPDDAVISMHYSVNAALSHYCRDRCTAIYALPAEKDSGLFYKSWNPEGFMRAEINQSRPFVPVATIRQHPRLWVLGLDDRQRPYWEALARGCGRVSEWQFLPFIVKLLEDC